MRCRLRGRGAVWSDRTDVDRRCPDGQSPAAVATTLRKGRNRQTLSGWRSPTSGTRRAATSTSPTRSPATGRSTWCSCRATSRMSSSSGRCRASRQFLDGLVVLLPADPLRQARHGHVRPGQRCTHAGDAHGRRARGDGRRRLPPCRLLRAVGGRGDEHPLRRDIPRADRGARRAQRLSAQDVGAGLPLGPYRGRVRGRGRARTPRLRPTRAGAGGGAGARPFRRRRGGRVPGDAPVRRRAPGRSRPCTG